MKCFVFLFCSAIGAVCADVLKFIPRYGEKPEFCHDLDCPSFKVEEKTKDYELRKYVATGWAATRITGMEFMPAETTTFMKLFKYIQGDNVKKEKIKMTAPVLTKIIPGPGPACESDFTMFFFMAPGKGTPPTPSDPSVYLTKNSTASFYVRDFPGYVTKFDTYLKQAEKLADALKVKGKEYREDYYFVAGYDSPFKFRHRHNEIWFVAED